MSHRYEISNGRWYTWVQLGGLEPNECQVCGECYFRVTVEGIGDVCIKHYIDWMLDDYTSTHDYSDDYLEVSER